MILAMLRAGNALLADNRVRRNIEQDAYEPLRALHDIQRNQILVDEAPDFSPVQLDTSKNRVILASSVRTVHAGLTKYGF